MLDGPCHHGKAHHKQGKFSVEKVFPLGEPHPEETLIETV